MAARKPFWKRPNVLLGVGLMLFGYLGPIVLAVVSPEVFAAIRENAAISGEVAGQSFSAASVDNLIVIAGLVTLLWPKIAELFHRRPDA